MQYRQLYCGLWENVSVKCHSTCLRGRDDSDYFIFQMFILICAENNSTKVSYENPVMVFLKHEDYIAEFWDGAKPK